MRNSREAYEKQIKTSPLFSLDRDRQPVQFRSEACSMVENLYRYLMTVNRNAYEPYGCEITETALRCIQNYRQDKGMFLPYFLSAWKMEFSHIRGRQATEAIFHGIKVSQEELRTVRIYLRYASQGGYAGSGETLQKQLMTEASGLTPESLAVAAALAGIRVDPDVQKSADGRERSLIDQQEDGRRIDEQIMTEENIREDLEKIDRQFLKLQSRQKAVISDVLTLRLFEILEESNIHPGDYVWISEAMYERCRLGDMLTQKEIARRYGKTEASISRSVNLFLQRLQEGAFNGFSQFAVTKR